MAGSAGGAFNGLYQGSSGAGDAAAALKPLLPNISVYNNGPSSAPTLQNQVTIPNAAGSSGGALSNFEHFLGGLGSDVGHIAGGAASWLGHNALNLAEAPVKLGEGIGHGIVDRLTLDDIYKQNAQNSARIHALAQQYKSGRITGKQYTLGLKEIGQDSQNIGEQAAGMVNKVTLDQKSSTEALINTATGLVTILTAGFGAATTTAVKVGAEGVALEPAAAKTAVDWLASNAAAPALRPVSDTISRLAADSRLFQPLDAVTKNVLQRATAEVVSQAGPTMTAGQIARATAVNVALKYPIYFNYMSTTAGQVYKELDQGKYGDAIRTLAFNAALVLSGGPIGQALKYGGDALKGVTERTFGQSSFWDELSKFYGDQNTSGFARAIADRAESMEPGARTEFIKNLAAVEATNLHAVGGDAVAAAARLAKGEQAKSLTTLTEIAHGDAIDGMVALAKNFRLADETAQKLKLGPVAVGRFDVRSKSIIANAVTQAEDTQGRLKAWEDLKAANPNDALANNASLDQQIKDAISKIDDTGELKRYITDIKAAKTVQGFPEDVANQMAKEGYIPIQPHNLQAPFVEGKGGLLTAHTEGEDFFTKAVQPLPVLGSVGRLLTGMGLSPNASTERVYQYFTDNVARNLGQTTAVKAVEKQLIKEQETKAALKAAKVAAKPVESATPGFSKDELAFMAKQGITPETNPEMFTKGEVKGEVQAGAGTTAETTKEVATAPKQINAADDILKRLSSLAHSLKIPTPDLRMLTNKQIRTELKISQGQASEIQSAIARAHLQTPLAVRGMGDRAVDWTYGLPVSSTIARHYLKIQGALRFSFNPFFQYLRLIPKTEMLTAAEGGGFIRSVFAGRAGELSDIRASLRAGGLLDQVGRIAGATGEAADFAGSTGRNLAKKLLPEQEMSIAGLIDAQAQRMGMTWQDYITQFPHQAADTIQHIAEYDRHSTFLNSPLARTLNVAFFPFRFDVKVAGIFAKSLAKTSLLTQVSVVNGLMKAQSFLNSPEGQAWYAENATAIKLFNYITPLAHLNEVMQSLVPGHDHSLGNFGELGGLPFGWIPQMLDAEGLTHFNQTGIDAKTGNAIPSYIPATAKGQAAIAIQDLIGSLFSYPGAEAGLPSKSGITRTMALDITGGSKSTDLQLNTPALTPQEQEYQKTLQENTGQKQPPKPSYQASPSNTADVKPTGQSAASKIQVKYKAPAAKKLKKSDYPVMLPPGQTQAGVL